MSDLGRVFSAANATVNRFAKSVDDLDALTDPSHASKIASSTIKRSARDAVTKFTSDLQTLEYLAKELRTERDALKEERMTTKTQLEEVTSELSKLRTAVSKVEITGLSRKVADLVSAERDLFKKDVLGEVQKLLSAQKPETSLTSSLKAEIAKALKDAVEIGRSQGISQASSSALSETQLQELLKEAVAEGQKQVTAEVAKNTITDVEVKAMD